MRIRLAIGCRGENKETAGGEMPQETWVATLAVGACPTGGRIETGVVLHR